jgi:AsmA protein
MKRILKFSLYGICGGGLLLVLVGAYLLTMFDPKAFQEEITKAVKESRQRTLTVEGEVKLMFFPKLGVNLGKISISEFQSDQVFAAIEGAQVALNFMPLLHGEAVVDEVMITGLQAVLVKHKSGASSIDDLLSKSDSAREKRSSQAKLKFDIAGVQIEKTQLTYRDEGRGEQYTLHDLSLKTGRILSGMPTPVAGSVRLQATKPAVDLIVQLKSTLTFDLDKKSYHLTGLEAQTKGQALDLTDLVIQARGDLGADLSSQAFNTKGLAISVLGTRPQGTFEVQLHAPRLDASNDKFTGEALSLSAIDNGTNTIKATLTLAKLAGSAQSFQSDDLLLSVQATGNALPNKSVHSELKGRVAFDRAKAKLDLDLAGSLLQSQIEARVAVTDFANPAIHFQADIDQFDADLFLPKSSAAEVKAAGSGAEQPFDLTALKDLNLEGSLSIGALKLANVKAGQIKIDLKAKQGVVHLSPLTANLYEGTMQGSATVNVTQALPSFAITQQLEGIEVAPLLKDSADFDTLEGKGQVGIEVTTSGNTASALKKGLNGNLDLNLMDGAIKGINVAKKLRDVGNLLGQQSQTESADKTEKTDFSELKASFKVTNGVAHNEDLSLKSPLLRLSGNGDIDLGESSINYLAKATLVKSLAGQGGADELAGLTVPIRASGPFTNLKYALDFESLASEVTKQGLETKTEELKTKAQGQLKDVLQGLFR